MKFIAINRTLAGTASLLALALSAPVAAQTVSDDSEAVAAEAAESFDEAVADASAEPASDIVVTGSRVPRAGFTAPTPVTVLGNEQLVKSSPSTLAESLRQLPALTNMSGPQRNSGTTMGGQSFLNLRSLGATRTLTLLDGRRVVSTT